MEGRGRSRMAGIRMVGKIFSVEKDYGRAAAGSKDRSRIIGDIIFAPCSFAHRMTERRNVPNVHLCILVAMQISSTG